MIAFIITAVLMLLLALFVVLRPLLRKATRVEIASGNANLAIYRDQFDELENDLKSGALSPDQYEAARLELERRLLEDSTGAPESARQARSGRVMPAAVGVLIPLVAVLLYLQIGSLEGLDAKRHAAFNASSITPEEFQSMTAKLAARLETNPEDGEGWMMLGRAYRAMQRNQEAAEAFKKAAALRPDDASLLADYAEALAIANGRTLVGEPTRLLERALKLDPNSDKVLALSGSAAFERKDYRAAIRHWEALLKNPQVGSELAQALQTGIAEARALSEGKKGAAAAPTPAGRLTGTVSLDPALRAQASPEDTVFVFARAAQGPRMPLAIRKVQVKDLPYSFTLDDSMAMMPEMKLSGFAEVVVGARISRSGAATPAAGDLEGVSATVKPGTSGVKVAINQVVK